MTAQHSIASTRLPDRVPRSAATAALVLIAVLLGGSPAVVLPELEVENLTTDSWSSDSMFASLKSSYPDATFWGSGPTLEPVGTSPSGGQRFIFDYRTLNGCHACATIATARIAFDFAPDGSYQSTTQLNLASPVNP